MLPMMGERPAHVPADLVIWGSTAALALIAGIGAAFALFSLFHRSAAEGLAAAAVVALSLGMALIGLTLRPAVGRLFVVLLAATTLVAFFAGSGAFASLVS